MKHELRGIRPGFRPRGIAMVLSLILICILVMLGIAVGTIGLANLRLVQHGIDSTGALQAAEAGLEELRNTIEANMTYGNNCENFGATLPITGASYQGSFSPGTSPASRQSINNLANSSAITRSDGTVVPPFTVDLIVTGRMPNASSNQSVTIGLMLTNRWENAVTTSGTFRATGGLNIKGASTLDGALQIMSGTSDGDLPGNFLVNSPSSDPLAVDIVGVHSISGVLTTPGVTSIEGGDVPIVRRSEPIPNITWSFYTPNPDSEQYQLLTESSYSNITFDNFSGKTEYYHSGSLSIIGGLTLTNVTLCVDGDLNVGGNLALQNSRLYVNGNLNVNGGIGSGGRGNSTGQIFVCGTGHGTNINGAMDLDTGNSTGVALYSQGNVTLAGGAHLQGLVYSHGNVSATGNARVIGIVIANGNAETHLSVGGGARFVYCPVYLSALYQMVENPRLRKISWRFIDN